MKSTITIVSFVGEVANIGDEDPDIETLTLENMPTLLQSFKSCSYHGTISDVPRDMAEALVLLLEKEVNLEEKLDKKTTICILVNSTVLYLDLLCNADDFTSHPLSLIGKAYLIRDKLDKVFDKKLQYLSQSESWFTKQQNSYEERTKNMKSIEVQLELLKLIRGSKQ